MKCAKKSLAKIVIGSVRYTRESEDSERRKINEERNNKKEAIEVKMK